METSVVRRRVNEAVERARRDAAERRTRSDEAARAYAPFLEEIAVPLFRQVAGSLKAGNLHFTVFTPSGSVRLSSDKSGEDFVELTLDTTGDRPVVMGHSSRARGGRVIESERPIGDQAITDLTDEDVLAFVLAELSPVVER